LIGLHNRLWLIASILAISCCACQQPEPTLSAAEIRAITNEFAAAARSASPVADVRTDPRADLRATDRALGSVDHLDVTIPKDSESPTVKAKLLRAIGSVAARHRLTPGSPSESREGLLLTYRRAGVATHTIHIHTSPAVGSPEPAAIAKVEGPRLAIILDDLGGDRAAADAIFALGYPLTISILPDQLHATEIAQQAQRRGFQVLLHLPMESVGGGHAESRELRPGMASKEVAHLVNQFLQAVPGAVGVNNHQGSQSTADEALMDELMPALRDHHLFYIDSRTTAATVAYDAAQRSGVPAAFRNVPFLDDVEQVAAVRKQLHIALRDAREKGDAVAIGHPHPATLSALREVLPEAKSQGVLLVLASELVR
jgi:hypothetical protein